MPPWSDELVAAAFVAGFPAALVMAWTFDIGPDGLTRTSASPAQGWIAVAFATLLMTGGTTALFYQIEPDVPATEEAASLAREDNSIAVYPFENLSSDPENAYFSIGMTSELVARLSQIDGLLIAGITTTKELALAQGLEPDVHYRLEGSVRKSGDRVRITAILTDRDSGFTVWSDEFDGELQDVLALQEQTALNIANALDMQLSPGDVSALARRDTEDPAAYEAFLRGWSVIESFHVSADFQEDKLAAARAHFRKALAIDPLYARAIAGLAMAENYAIYFGLEPASNLARARGYADQAMALDDSLPETNFAMAGVLVQAREFGPAVAAYRRTLELDSQNGYAWCELSSVLNIEDPVAAESAAREAIRFRPAYTNGYSNLGAALQKQGRPREAMEAYQQSLLLSPGNRFLQEQVRVIQQTLGNDESGSGANE